MEAIAATASISALVGVAGQSVKLIFKLSNIWHSLVRAPAEVDELIQGLKLLEEVLQHTETIAVKYRALNSSPNSTVTSLHQAVKLCRDHLVEWLEEVESLRPVDVQRPRRWIKKLKAASHQACIHQIGEKVRSHLEKITLLVNVLSGDLGIQSSRNFDELCTGIQGLRATHFETEARQMTLLEAVGAGINDLKKQGVQKNDERRNQISRWISTVPYVDHHALVESSRLPGTGQWLLGHPDFKDWILNEHSEILWLHGPPGAGKTHVLSLAIGELLGKYPNATAYFYCSYGDAERCNSISVLRSFLRQLYRLIDGPNPVAKLYKQREEDGFIRESLTLQEIVDLIKQMLRLKGLENRTFLALDGLDECDMSSRVEILQALQDIASDSSIWVKLIIGSRDNKEIELRLDGCRNVYLHSFDTLPDIFTFVRHELKKRISEKRLLRGEVSDALRSRIESALLNGSNGMFLWVRLQIDRICEAKQANDLDVVLQELPRGLGDTYNNILWRIILQRPQDVLLAKRAFQWILYSAYPLSAQALAKALSVNLDGGTYYTVNVSLILDVCQNLVALSQSSGDLYLVHATARAFLSERLDANEAHVYITKVCIAILQCSSDSLEPPTASLERDELNDYASLNWPIHSSSVKTSLGDLPYWEYRFMTNLRHHDWWINYLSLYHIGPQEFGFGPHYNYFDVLVHRHCRTSISIGPLISASYFNLVRTTTALIKHGKESGVLSNATKALHVAVERGHSIIVALLIQNKLVEPDSRTGMNMSPLHRAAYMGHTNIVAMLLGSRRVDVNARNTQGMTALLFASNCRHEDSVMLLLTVPNIDVNQEGFIHQNTGMNALTLSSARGSTVTVKMLLKTKGVDVNYQGSTGETCLHYAASSNHGDIIRHLLTQPDLSVNAKDFDSFTALHHASLHGCSEAVKELLKSSHLDPNSVDKYHRSALLIALQYRHLEVMTHLLGSEKTDVNVVDRMGNSPLILAAAQQYTADTKLLLGNKQILVNIRNRHGTTALHWAINNQNNDLTRLLLDNARGKLDINARNNKGSAPLMLAASWGNSQIVKWLLEIPTVIVNLTDAKGYTSLDWALRHGRNECVVGLRAHGAQESGKLLRNPACDFAGVSDSSSDSESESESESGLESYVDIGSDGDSDMDSIQAVDPEPTALEYLKLAGLGATHPC